MADLPEDSTRDLIADAENLLSDHAKKGGKGKADAAAQKLVADADKLVKKGAPDKGDDPSTRQLLVDAEKLIERKQAGKKGGGTLIAVAVIILLGGVVAAYLLLA